MIKIPTRIRGLLEGNTQYYSFVLSCIGALEPWIKDNKTVFFPEYTDHGCTHLNEVLLTADSIISDESWLYMTPHDAALIVVSVLLHDCAMHITEDGFYALIANRVPEIESRHTGKELSWRRVWGDFFAEAKRFDATKLRSIFGDETPVRDIPDNKIDLTGRDRLLIGEFVRRYHARIAHEIAFYGVPGPDGQTLVLPDEPDGSFLDLCGFVARSHNLSLRSAVDKIEKRKKQVHLNAHVPFVMLVLRIADFIQIHSERAPKQLLRLKSLVSPVSRREWGKHHAIVEINQAHEDPEAIYVDAEPKDALEFESLRKLFSDIQNELDLSWSVLGEVYGRYDNLNKMGICIRRIRSSLDSVSDFIVEKSPDYIPRVLSFRTADSEMMELLISPLYGDAPEVGIRELLQNSVDACAEIKDLVDKKVVAQSEEKAFDVCVTLKDFGDSGGQIVIEDYGVGMTLDVVENYFLNIGASFRNSDRWRKEHETDGHSDVYRTGRFGIGLLAAYLLGDKLCVETRHVTQNEEEALFFECMKGEKEIIVSHRNFHVGTRITIDISLPVKMKLLKNESSWDWFCLDFPRVIRKIVKGGEETVLKQRRSFPLCGENIKGPRWRRTTVEGYDDIFWTFDDVLKSSFRPGRTGLVCNGVVIADSLFVHSLDISSRLNAINAKSPTLNIYDQDGRFPINLQRNGIVGREFPFMDELAKDVSSYMAEEFWEFLVKSGQGKVEINYLKEIINFTFPGFEGDFYGRNNDLCKFLISDGGVIPLDYDLIKGEGVKRIFIDAANLAKNRGCWNSDEFLNICDNYVLVDGVSGTKQSRCGFIKTFFELRSHGFPGLKFSVFPVCGARMLLKKSDVSDVVSTGYVSKRFWRELTCEWENEDWVLMANGSVPEIDFNVDKIAWELQQSESFGFSLCYLDWDMEKDFQSPSKFYEAWIKKNKNISFSGIG